LDSLQEILLFLTLMLSEMIVYEFVENMILCSAVEFQHSVWKQKVHAFDIFTSEKSK